MDVKETTNYITREKLESMKNDGWSEIRSMSAAECDAFLREFASANVGRGSVLSYLAKEAREEIEKRRRAIHIDEFSRNNEQTLRMSAISNAAGYIARAICEIDKALYYEAAPGYDMVSMHAPLDVAGMTDDELSAEVKRCENDLFREPTVYHQYIGLLKTPEAKKLTAQVKPHELEVIAFLESARNNRDAAKAELDRRRRESEEREAREEAMRENLLDVINGLQARIDELESTQPKNDAVESPESC